MASSSAKTVKDYLASLPAERRAVMSRVRDLILRKLPRGYRETMNWGMICYEMPLEAYPDTYNGQPLGCAALAAQKQYFALYIFVYPDPKALAALKAGFKKAGKKLDMGKCCLRFRSLDDLPLDVVGRAIASMPPRKLIAMYEKSRKKKS